MNLKERLEKNSEIGILFEKLDSNKVKCLACGHKCVISEGTSGVCKVRHNINGDLYVPHDYVAGFGIDPIEKKPFFHVLPGSRTLSFGMLGCNFHCSFCQNYITSQALKDPNCKSDIEEISSDDIINISRKHNLKIIVSTYNEPLITSEWAVEIFQKAKKLQARCGYVSNGYVTDEVLGFIRPYVDFYKVDLKTFNADNYKRICGGNLEIVKKAIEQIFKKGFWLEIVTLVVPGFNDSEDEFKNISKFIYNISPDIPWHVTAFHPDYKMTESEQTDVNAILKAVRIGKNTGLKYVYSGNLRLQEFENTYCPGCRELLVQRNGYFIEKIAIIIDESGKGRCPKCNQTIAGVW
jgi:pyruvate formate lyase activating enzyme